MIVKFLDKLGNMVKSITSIAYLPVDTEPVEDSDHLITSGAVDAVTESLQEQVDDIAGKAGSGYTPKGEASVADLNTLSGQENGELYTLTDAGTLTDGSLAVVAGDTVAWDATNNVWYKAMNYAPSEYGTNEVHNLTTTATESDLVSGSYLAIDGSDGTKKAPCELFSPKSVQDNLSKSIAPMFNSSTSYDAGDPVTYEGTAYIFIHPHSGAWNASDVKKMDILSYLDTTISDEGEFNKVVKGLYLSAANFTAFNNGAIIEVIGGRLLSGKYRVGIRVWTDNYGSLTKDFTIASDTAFSELPDHVTMEGFEAVFDWDFFVSNSLDYYNFSRRKITVNPVVKNKDFFYIWNAVEAKQAVSALNASVADLYDCFDEYPAESGNVYNDAGATPLNLYISGSSIASSSITRMVYIPCKPNQVYTVSVQTDKMARFSGASTTSVPSSGSTCNLYFDYTTAHTTQDGRSYWVLTTNSTAAYLCIYYFNAGAQADTEESVRATIMVAEGDSKTAYIPYKSGYKLKEIALPDSVQASVDEDEFTSRSKIYGVEIDNSVASSVCTRIGDAKGKRFNFQAGNSMAFEHANDFDNIYPWRLIRRCNIDSGEVVAYEGDNTFAVDGSNGDVFVEIPKFYSYRKIDGDKERICISGVKHSGFEVEPAFVDKDGRELDFIYVAVYSTGQGTEGQPKHSVSGEFPLTSWTISNFINDAADKGYSVYDIAALNALQKLILIENGDKNLSQYYEGFGHLIYDGSVKCGQTYSGVNTIEIYGSNLIQYIRVGQYMRISGESEIRRVTAITDVSYDSVVYHAWKGTLTLDGDAFDVVADTYVSHLGQPSGDSDIMTYHTGRSGENGISACRYRWIENLWGNVWMQTAGILIKDLDYYYTFNPEKYESDIGQFTKVEAFKATEQTKYPGTAYGWVVANGCDRSEPSLILPKTLGTNSQAYYSAKEYVYDQTTADGGSIPAHTEFMCVSGGGWDHLDRNSPFTLRFWTTRASGASSTLYGSRFVIRKKI